MENINIWKKDVRKGDKRWKKVYIMVQLFYNIMFKKIVIIILKEKEKKIKMYLWNLPVAFWNLKYGACTVESKLV